MPCASIVPAPVSTTDVQAAAIPAAAIEAATERATRPLPGTASAASKATVRPARNMICAMDRSGTNGWKIATPGSWPLSHGPLTTGKIFQYDWLPLMSSVPSTSTNHDPTATSGAVSRPGRRTPAVNPSALNATTLAAATTTGHQSGPPQLTWCAVTPYTTATHTPQPTSAQIAVAAQVASSRTHWSRAVVVIRSVT